MKPITAEWLAKADGDLTTARRELRSRRSPNYDAACFHAQQCVEKHLKAWLVEQGHPFPKIHDVAVLLDLCEGGARWDLLRPEMDWITSLAVEVRYPGESAEKDDAKKAVAIADLVRTLVRRELRLTP